MGNLRSDSKKEPALINEEDEIYEKIEAPKFVDFTVPDRSRPDDGSWFCVRIGCDQKHEEVDPDALYKSFVLRVMAARSPNLRLQKTLNRQALSKIPKCPHSAPAKSTKDRVPRFSTVTAIPEKIANPKLKNHPISNLRLTPIRTKAKEQPSSSGKALTTPRRNKCPNNQELFRSVRNKKVPITVPKNRSVAKALVFHTPKRAAEATIHSTCRGPILESCAETEKLTIGSLTKHVPRRHLCKSSRCAAYDPNCSEPTKNAEKSQSHACQAQTRIEEATMNSKKKSEGHLQISKEEVHDDSHDMEMDGNKGNECEDGLKSTITNVEESLPSSVASAVKESSQSAVADTTSFNNSKIALNSEQDSEEKVAMLQTCSGAGSETMMVENATYSDDNKENADVAETMMVENATYSDDNKENTAVTYHETRDVKFSNTTNVESESSHQHETCGNLPQKAVAVPRKTFQAQGGKYKRMKATNPKPFRLRTDERGILKEANLERRLHLQSQKEAVPVTVSRHGDGMQQQNVKSSHRQDYQLESDKGVQKSQPNGVRTTIMLARFAEPKMVIGQKLEDSKGKKAIQKAQNKIVKVASLRQQLVKPQSVKVARKALVPRLDSKMETLATISRPKEAVPSESQVGNNNNIIRGKRPATIPKEPNFHKIHVPKSCTKRTERVISCRG